MNTTSNFQFVTEDDPFLKLFPHRWDFIYAQHCKQGEKPEWHTEGRYPLKDREILQGACLYGVSFGVETNYFVLDIDAGSQYHPKRDRFAVGRIMDALAPLGVTDFIPITSSYSNGVHLYFPLAQTLNSNDLAQVLTQLLKFQGLLVEDGRLEIFPNVRLYDDEKQRYSQFKAHRLPLQVGSYLLTENWELQYTTPAAFCKLWQFCQYRNEVNEQCFDQTLKLVKRNYTKLGFKGEKFLTDLNTEIDMGWSGHGQTNRLLGRITLRAYVFGHRLLGEAPLTGDRLVAEIVKTATRLPGYAEFCRHRHEIYNRAEEWARCVENSKYYPYGSSPFKKEPAPEKPAVIGWNQWNRKEGIARLCFAIADLLNQERFPAGTTERFEIFTHEYGFSGETLYKPEYLELWHPNFIGIVQPVETPPDPPNSLEPYRAGLLLGSASADRAKSLLPNTERKDSSDKALRWFEGWSEKDIGCNPLLDKDYTPLDTDSGGDDGSG